MTSPFSQAAGALLAKAYLPLPIMPGSKAPGRFVFNKWRGMRGWSDLSREHIDVPLWGIWPDAGVGVLCGNPQVDGWQLVCIDLDADEPDILDMLISALPHSPCRKKGKRGLSLFYKAPVQLNSFSERGLFDVLCKGRQTLLPPTIHPDTGKPYVWIGEKRLDEVDLADLPTFDEDAAERLKDTAASIAGAEPLKTTNLPLEKQPIVLGEGETPHRILNNTALQNLDKWVPDLCLPKARKTGANSFEAVPVWRDSSTGRPLEQRKASLKFHATGIKDMGADQGYTPIDVVMAATGKTLDEAFQFLVERLGQLESWPSPGTPPELLAHDPETGEVLDRRYRNPEPQSPSAKPLEKPRGQITFLSDNAPYVHEPELIRDTLPLTGVAFIAGQSGAGKTFLAIELATCIMTGVALAGRSIEHTGGVLYCAFEGAGTIPGRVIARRSLLSDPNVRLPFAVMEGFGAVLKPADYIALGSRLRTVAEQMQAQYGVPLRAVIIDTVSAAGMIAPDAENDPGAWQAIFDGLNPISKSLQCLMVPIHHMGKSAEAGLRGSSNARAGADAVLAMTCTRDEITGDARDHNLALTKSRCAPEGSIAAVTFDKIEIGSRPDGSPVTSLVIKFDGSTIVKKVPKGRKAGKGVMTLKQALDNALAQFGEVQHVGGKTDAPVIRAVPYSRLRDAFDSIYATGNDAGDPRRLDAVRKALARAIEVRNAAHDDVATRRWNNQDWVWLPKGWADEM